MAPGRPRRLRWQLVVLSAVLLALIAFATLPLTTAKIPIISIRLSSNAGPSKHSDLTHGNLTIRANSRNDADPTWLPAEMQAYMGTSQAEFETLTIPDDYKTKLRAARKGLVHFCRMRTPADVAPWEEAAFKPGPMKSAAELLNDYGWSHWLDHQAVLTYDDLGSALHDLGISEAYDDWFVTIVKHISDSNGGGSRVYPATSANYNNRVNLKDGVLVAVSNFSPEFMIKEKRLPISGAQLIPLRRWSDVFWLAREQAIVDYGSMFTSVAKLEHIFRIAIINQETDKIFQLVTGKSGPQEVGPWPGLSYPISEPQALAALSAPNCYGVAWLLSQHKQAMGARMIDRINIFDCVDKKNPNIHQWCAYMHIVDSV